MKKYIKPSSEPISIATETIMDMSLVIYNGDPTIIDNYPMINDGSEILTNHNNKLWDYEGEEY